MKLAIASAKRVGAYNTYHSDLIRILAGIHTIYMMERNQNERALRDSLRHHGFEIDTFQHNWDLGPSVQKSTENHMVKFCDAILILTDYTMFDCDNLIRAAHTTGKIIYIPECLSDFDRIRTDIRQRADGVKPTYPQGPTVANRIHSNALAHAMRDRTKFNSGWETRKSDPKYTGDMLV